MLRRRALYNTVNLERLHTLNIMILNWTSTLRYTVPIILSLIRAPARRLRRPVCVVPKEIGTSEVYRSLMQLATALLSWQHFNFA